MENTFENGTLTVYLQGRLDARAADGTDRQITDLCTQYKPTNVIADCEQLEYIASAGLRVLLKLGKTTPLSLVNVSRDVYSILDLTGFTKIFDTKRLMREISVDGCEIIGKGLSSTVYRIDRETIVKVFSERVTLDRIYRETESAKKSFVAGISTAIPYDVVRCRGYYGTVFELIDAGTLSRAFMDQPERFDELMDMYVALLKQFHSTKAEAGSFPDIRDKYHTWATNLERYLTEEESRAVVRMIDAVPVRDTMIHVDCHSGNIMAQKDKLVFVDMADVSIGHPLFDIGAEYFHYVHIRRTSLGAKTIFGVEPADTELPTRVWNELVRRYFAGESDERLAEIHEMLQYFGCLRCLIMVAKHAQIAYSEAMELVNLQREWLFPHADRAIELFSKADEYFKI